MAFERFFGSSIWVSTVYTFSAFTASEGILAGCNNGDNDREILEKRLREAEQRRDQAAAAAASSEAHFDKRGVDASSFAAPVDPPSSAGDLKEEVARYTSLGACVSARAQAIDPLLSDSLGALGYDTFLRDSCRMLEATKAEDAGACAPIVAGQLRDRCHAWVGMAKADPNICPFEGEPAAGRDPVCLAGASRNEHLCMAATSDRRGACVALVRGDVSACAGAPHAEACRREVLRWKELVETTSPKDKPPPFTPPTVRLELHGIDDTTEPLVPVTTLAALAERGVVVLRSSAAKGKTGDTTITLGAPDDYGLTSYAPPAHGTPSVSLRLKVHGGDGLAEIDHLALTVPGVGILVLPGVRWDGTVRWSGDDSVRGSPCQIHLEGKIGVAPKAYQLKLDVQTYIVDSVAP